MPLSIQDTIQLLEPKQQQLNTTLRTISSTFKAYQQKQQKNRITQSVSTTTESAENQNFFETVGAKGGGDVQKGRDSTLQEFVLSFLFFSLLLFGVAILVSTYITSGGNVGQAARTFGLYALVVFVGLAMLLRFA